VVKDLKEWLSSFDENEDLSIVVVDTKKRIVYENKNVMFITDKPAIFIEVGKAEPMDGDGHG
jgi:hypothetical protein